MEITVTQKVKVNAKFLQVKAGLRYWEDAIVNGVEDESGDLIPCREDDYWCPLIDIDSGQILNWKQGVTADIHYKVCDDGVYTVLDENKEIILEKDGYVIDSLAIEDTGHGDYIIIKVDENGFINNWKFDYLDFHDGDEN